MTALWSAAVEVLRDNWMGTATLPSREQYPHQWSWDSAFISVGWAHIDPGRAQQELVSLFRGQWSSGRVPQIVFNTNADAQAYFPGPDFWQSDTIDEAPVAPTSGIVQPPVHARAVLRACSAEPESASGQEFLRRMYPRLVAWHAYLRQCRELDGTGLASIVHPWESGLDNSPSWDHVLAEHEYRPDETFVRRDLTHVSTANRPTDADYRAYVALAREYRDAGYSDQALPDHRFVVEDPLFNAVFLDAELCCAAIASLLAADPAKHLNRAFQLHESMMRYLWDPGVRRFRSRDARTGVQSGVDTIGSLMPLLDPWLPTDVLADVEKLAWSDDFIGGCEYPVPSTSLTAVGFDRERYWRGPTWINTNWLLWTAAGEAHLLDLAGRIAESSLGLVSRSGFREYFDPLSGSGLGAEQFSWTAALTLDFLSNDGQPRRLRANPAQGDA
jgi:hypothetical protein